jgi:hypothetical protein
MVFIKKRKIVDFSNPRGNKKRRGKSEV